MTDIAMLRLVLLFVALVSATGGAMGLLERRGGHARFPNTIAALGILTIVWVLVALGITVALAVRS